MATALPNAKIIHGVRDIRDAGLSIYARNFNLQPRWATDVEHIADYWRGDRRLMDHWRAATGLAMIDVVHGDTVAHLAGKARRLLDFLDLPWGARVPAFHEDARAVQTRCKRQVRQPL